jgi:DNA-binding beta-propeller fold protein YncE
VRAAAYTLAIAVGAIASAAAAAGEAESGNPAATGGPGTRFEARFEISLHSSPDGPGFHAPRGVSTDPFGNVFVADTGNHRVVQFDADGRFVFDFGGHGWGQGELSGPTDVSAREGFRLFVVDAGNDRIQEFDIGDSSPEGTVFPFGEGRGLGGEELVRPSRMDVDREGRIYVSDDLCHCVWIFAPTGELVSRLGGLGSAPSRFRDPAGVAVGPKGRVFVADAGNRRVQVFDAIGNWSAAWGGPDEDFLDHPSGIDVGPDGNVWVSDAGSGLVRVLTPDGLPLFSFGGAGGGPGRFRAPVDLALGPDGRVWVVDAEREVVEGYRIARVAEER